MAISNSKKHCTLQCRVETLPADSNCDKSQLTAVTNHLPLINWLEIPTLDTLYDDDHHDHDHDYQDDDYDHHYDHDVGDCDDHDDD